jgi:thymidylate synthase
MEHLLKKYNNANEAYEDMYKLIMENGVDKEGTKSINNVCFEIQDPLNNYITNKKRKWKPDYAKMEWQWYKSKNRSVTEIAKHAKIWNTMHDGSGIVNSNYGWQISRNDQFNKIIHQLKQNPFTRRAVLSIYDGKEIEDYTHDTPCTIAINFYCTSTSVDDISVNMTVLMRSNDLVYGFCNDQYCFSKLLELVASLTNYKIGKYTHFATDMHIYERHFNL